MTENTARPEPTLGEATREELEQELVGRDEQGVPATVLDMPAGAEVDADGDPGEDVNAEVVSVDALDPQQGEKA